MNDRIQKARLSIFIKEPFLGYVLQQLNILIVNKNITAYTNGISIVIGKDFLHSITDNDLIFILIHELMHIVLKHVARSNNLDKHRFNVACDIVVNDIISFYNIEYESIQPLRGKDFKILGIHNTAELVYKNLPKGIKTTILDIHDFWFELDGDQTNENIDKIMKEVFDKRVNIINSHFSRYLTGFRFSSKKHHWAHILEKVLIKDVFDYTFNRIDQRYQDVILPSFIETEESLNNVWFVIDASGSMSNELIEMMFGEVKRIISHYRNVSCDISFFTTNTSKPIKLKNDRQLLDIMKNLDYSGGTDFTQIFENLNVFYKTEKPKAIFILTDGYARLPDNDLSQGIPLYWVTDNEDLEPGFGQCININ